MFSSQLGAERSYTRENKILGRTLTAPWLSMPLGTDGDLYFSGNLGINYQSSENPVFIPELSRMEIQYRFSSQFSMRSGRFSWRDPSLFTAGGSFDGVEIVYDPGFFTLGAAFLYTGFLHRNSVDVSVSPGDSRDYSALLDWADFSGTYFSVPRFIGSLYGEFPVFPFGRGVLNTGIMVQFDNSGAEEKFNTQYFLLRYTLFYRRWDFAFSGAVQLVNTAARGFMAGFATAAECGIALPGALTDRLSFGLRWASGAGPVTAAYFPVTREAQGLALRPALTGIMTVRVKYENRINPSLFAEIGGRYFLRTDASSFSDPDLGHQNLGADSYLLGAEFDAGILWVPFSDLSFSFSAGAFFPQTGIAMRQADLRWFINVGTIFSF